MDAETSGVSGTIAERNAQEPVVTARKERKRRHRSPGSSRASTVSTPQSPQSLQNSVSESRHGRPRRLTARAQEAIDNQNAEVIVQRKRNRGNATKKTRRNRNLGNYVIPDGFYRNVQSDDEDEDDSRAWCFCNENSHGDMIRCDNADCALRWFHQPCIGMVEPPAGKWYCPRCVVAGELKRISEDEDDI